MAPSIRIGTAGWTIPRDTAVEAPTTGTHLERYARSLNCAEINSSFYRPHRLTTWAKWAASVPTDFRFSVKAPKAITHEAKLACSREQLTSFLDQANALGGTLGPILFQLPPKLAFDPAVAETFLTLLRDLHAGPVVCEPRHPSWFSAEPDALLSRFQVARVAADPALVPAGNTFYYRLHGSPRVYYSAYSEGFLQTLAGTIQQQPDRVERWCIFDNTAAGAAFHDAHSLQHLLAHHKTVLPDGPTDRVVRPLRGV